jgi:hypothetical protein
MKILYQIGSQFRDDQSDESLWLIMTKKYLEELGYSIWLSSLSDINLKEFDIIHIVNCTPVTDAYGFFKMLRLRELKSLLRLSSRTNMRTIGMILPGWLHGEGKT